jgi:hypothetical protein
VLQTEVVEAMVAATEQLFVQGANAGSFVEKNNLLDVIGR